MTHYSLQQPGNVHLVRRDDDVGKSGVRSLKTHFFAFEKYPFQRAFALVPDTYRRNGTIRNCCIRTDEHEIVVQNPVADHRISPHPQQEIAGPPAKQFTRLNDLFRLRNCLQSGPAGMNPSKGSPPIPIASRPFAVNFTTRERPCSPARCTSTNPLRAIFWRVGVRLLSAARPSAFTRSPTSAARSCRAKSASFSATRN